MLQQAALDANNPIGDLMNNTEWAFPAAECVHIVGFAIAIGTIFLVDLRLLGVGPRQQSAAVMQRDTQLWTLFGLLMVLFSGPMILLSDPQMYFRNVSFHFKMTALALALIFNFTVHRMVAANENASRGLSVIVALISIALWVSVIGGGLFIAFL